MRLLLLLSIAVAACSPPTQPPPPCQPGTCATGQHCVFTTATGDAKCTTACELDGGCATGSCTCRRYSTSTQDCVPVCQ